MPVRKYIKTKHHGYMHSGHIGQINPRQTHKENIQLPTKSRNCRCVDYRNKKRHKRITNYSEQRNKRWPRWNKLQKSKSVQEKQKEDWYLADREEKGET